MGLFFFSIFLFSMSFFFFFGGHTTQLVGSEFLIQGLNPGPLQWKPRVLITALPGNSQEWGYNIVLPGIHVCMYVLSHV